MKNGDAAAGLTKNMRLLCATSGRPDNDAIDRSGPRPRRVELCLRSGFLAKFWR